VTSKTISKFQAISGLIPAFNSILKEHNLQLSEIACVGINTGPGPFNTLRSIIATANALAFAQHIPLVGCNGLELLLENSPDKNTVVILDAFGNDVYFGIQATQEYGYDSIEHVLSKIENLDQHHLVFIGNGAVKHKDIITQKCTNPTIDEDILFASTQNLIDATIAKFAENKTEREIFPLYFASPVVKN
jgi:tRNA threonylcarbamoyl adenosine modification protein YeaZ